MAAKKHPSGIKPASRMANAEKPQILLSRAEKIENFVFEWGRVAIPSAVFGLLALLYFAGAIDKIGLGYAIGLVLLLAMPLAVIMVVWRGYFPKWAHTATIVFTILYLVGTIWPFTNMVYPGVPEFSQNMTKEGGALKLPADIKGGYYWVEVFGKSFADVAGVRNERGRYKVLLNGDPMEGEFSDQMIAAAGQEVDGTTLRQMKAMKFEAGPMELRAPRVDKAIGPTITVSGYHMAVPPTVFFGLLALVLAWAVFVDGWFQDQTWKWRLAPWVGVSLVFLAVFYASWEPSRMPGTSVWSGVIGGIGGFLAGWILSVIGRWIIGKVRTRIS